MVAFGSINRARGHDLPGGATPQAWTLNVWTRPREGVDGNESRAKGAAGLKSIIIMIRLEKF